MRAYIKGSDTLYTTDGNIFRLKIGEVLTHIANEMDCELLGNFDIDDAVIKKIKSFLSYYTGFSNGVTEYKKKSVLQAFSAYVSEKNNENFRYHIPPFIFKTENKPEKKIFIIRNLKELIDFEIYNVLTNHIIIKICGNCGWYFIADRKNQMYCDYPKADGITCRSVGANNTYIKAIKKKLLGEEYLKAKGRLHNQFAYGSILYQKDYEEKLSEIDTAFDTYQKEHSDKNKTTLLALIKRTQKRGFTVVFILKLMVAAGALVWLLKIILSYFGIQFLP
ncbi:MAG: hypothetical protein BWY15_02162 [Firmicutes bacterium ADurb.Bin193]|nr:MAG: hypothetical protein BWY15_02162 [Firmicutes bacterium ADurb.Bin193]